MGAKTDVARAVLFLAAGLLSSSPAAERLTLVDDGRPVCAIVLAKRPVTPAWFGAMELQHHLKLISGAEVPMVTEGEAFGGVGVYIGETDFARKHGFQGKDFKLEESQVKFAADGIILIGRDIKSYAKPVYGTLKNLPGFYCYHKGSLYATYNFLERHLGVRWYAPTEMGICYVPRRTVAVEPRDLRQRPVMNGFRRAWMPRMYEALDKEFSEFDRHMLKLRWRDSFNYGYCNHNVYSIWFQYWDRARDPEYARLFIEKRPEYFAQGYKGKSDRFQIAIRPKYPNDPDLPPQLCNSNEDVVRHFADEAARKWDGTADPRLGVSMPRMEGEPWFYPIEPDDNNGFCLCDRCRAAFKDKWVNGRRPTNYIHFDWISRIAREAKRLNPAVNICTLAYNSSLKYPAGLDIAGNVGIQMCVLPYDFWVEYGGDAAEYQEWVDHGEPRRRMMSVWTYMYGANWYAFNVERTRYCFPMFAHTNTARLFRKFAADGMQGWFGETPDEVGAPFWQGQLENYIAYKMVDDPTLDADRLIAEFFPLFYGAAAEPMRKFYELVERASWVESKAFYKDTFVDGDRRRVPIDEEFNWGRIGTQARMDQLAKYVSEAQRLVKTPQERHRMKWFMEGLWEPMLKGRANYNKKLQFRSRPVSSDQVARVASANGDAEKVDWSHVSPGTAFKMITGFPVGPVRQQLRFAHDGRHFYLRYSEWGDMSRLVSKRDIWTGDEVEAFFAAEARRPYIQYAANPEGRHTVIGNYYENMIAYSHKTTNNARIRSVLGKDRWDLYLAIPLDEIAPGKTYKSGDAFRFNFFRWRPEMVSLAWSPTFDISFHKVDRMGKLKLD